MRYMGAYPGVGTCPGYYGNSLRLTILHLFSYEVYDPDDFYCIISKDTVGPKYWD